MFVVSEKTLKSVKISPLKYFGYKYVVVVLLCVDVCMLTCKLCTVSYF